MRYKHLYCILQTIFFCNQIFCFEPVTTAIFIGVTTLTGVIYQKATHCWFEECCNNNIWYNLSNVNTLEMTLQKRLHGQHIAINTIIPTIKRHVFNKNPSKALVLSFHGWTGSGKNFVAKIIAETLYKKGMNSQYVHHLISTLHFPHHELTNTYKENIQNWIRGNISQCRHQLFIFDEVDKMHPSVLDALHPFLEFHRNIDNVNYRHSIFIFLSNSGGRLITSKLYEFFNKGIPREELRLSHFESLLTNDIFNDERHKGLWHSHLIEKHIITAIIPFLPLEKIHVKLCIKDYLIEENMLSQSFNDTFIDLVANELVYTPTDLQLYSTSGCKRIADKCDLLLSDNDFFSEK